MDIVLHRLIKYCFPKWKFWSYTVAKPVLHNYSHVYREGSKVSQEHTSMTICSLRFLKSCARLFQNKENCSSKKIYSGRELETVQLLAGQFLKLRPLYCLNFKIDSCWYVNVVCKLKTLWPNTTWLGTIVLAKVYYSHMIDLWWFQLSFKGAVIVCLRQKRNQTRLFNENFDSSFSWKAIYNEDTTD